MQECQRRPYQLTVITTSRSCITGYKMMRSHQDCLHVYSIINPFLHDVVVNNRKRTCCRNICSDEDDNDILFIGCIKSSLEKLTMILRSTVFDYISKQRRRDWLLDSCIRQKCILLSDHPANGSYCVSTRKTTAGLLIVIDYFSHPPMVHHLCKNMDRYRWYVSHP